MGKTKQEMAESFAQLSESTRMALETALILNIETRPEEREECERMLEALRSTQ
jgi:hypothetical protein